ncbi:EF hand domain-containing protein [Cyclospora cayetanensis]|uniref:EF hand domain-containing protein n=1 Tax=Cyclospora cayetanensis TaxID=88456 RepID=A0A1D3D2Q6_9EIME|nr:EF hand domain-containing protein [Cyclospora cayetanensis]
MFFSRFLHFLLPVNATKKDLGLSSDKLLKHSIGSSASNSCCYCHCCEEQGGSSYNYSGGNVCVAQLLRLEVEAHHTLEVQRRILAGIPDFQVLDAFRFIEESRSAAITPMSLSEALAGEGFILTHREQQLIFHRLDRDCDGRLNYLEFVEAVMPSNCTGPCTSLSPICTEALRNMRWLHTSAHHCCPCSLFHSASSSRLASRKKGSAIAKRSTSCTDGEHTWYSPRACSCRSNMGDYSCSACAPLEHKDNTLLCSMGNKKLGNSSVASGCEVAVALNSQINTERRLECLREKLALKSDFNILQFWGLFDTEGRGYATAPHIKDALHFIGLHVTLTQARLFAEKLTSDSEPRLRYADMAKAFLPTKSRYAKAMINRISNGHPKCPAPLAHLAPETLEIVASIFDLIVASEEQAELLRHRLCLKDLSSAFRDLDKNGDGYITATEFSELLVAHGFYPSEAELDALVNHYDKNGDKKVSYAEFVNEIGRTRCPMGCCRLICLCSETKLHE